MLEFCKTRSNKSSPDMFNFYLILPGHDMIIDAGRATTIRRNFKAPWLQTKVQKMQDLSKTWVFTRKVWRFQTKKRTKTKLSTFQKHPKEHTAPNCNYWIGTFRKHGFLREKFEDFRRKKEQKQNSRPFKNTQWNTWPLNATIQLGLGNHAEINWRKKEKSVQIGTVGTLQN